MKLSNRCFKVTLIFILITILSLNISLFSMGKDSLMSPEILEITNQLVKSDSIDLSKWKNEYTTEKSIKDSITNIKEKEKIQKERNELFENYRLRFENLIVEFDKINNVFTRFEKIEKLNNEINEIEFDDIRINLLEIVNPIYQDIRAEKKATEIELNKFKPQFIKDLNDMELMVYSDLNENSKKEFLAKFKEKWDKYAKTQNDKLLFMRYNRFFIPKLIQSKSTNMNLILVECGNVKKDNDDIILYDFYIGETEVTQKEYQKVMGKNPSNFKDHILPFKKNKDYIPTLNSFYDRNPVETVSWYDALKFCNKLSEMDGLEKCYAGIENHKVTCNFNADGYRLPIEDEWEHAAKGGNYSKGYEYSGGDSPNWVAIFEEKSDRIRKEPSYVKSCHPNELGIYDMSGNVWEWCWDVCKIEFDHNEYRIIRGGGWNSPRENIRIKSRSYGSPIFDSGTWGFRIVRNALNK